MVLLLVLYPLVSIGNGQLGKLAKAKTVIKITEWQNLKVRAQKSQELKNRFSTVDRFYEQIKRMTSLFKKRNNQEKVHYLFMILCLILVIGFLSSTLVYINKINQALEWISGATDWLFLLSDF